MASFAPMVCAFEVRGYDYRDSGGKISFEVYWRRRDRHDVMWGGGLRLKISWQPSIDHP